MTIKRILLTGDDGYNAIGTRLLIHFLRDDFALTLAGTKTQQSGVGGMIHVAKGGSYTEMSVDGVGGICVEGSPADAVETARSFYNTRYDLIISGVNMGVNVSSAVISSGTFGAAYRALGIGLAPRVMAISWDAHMSHALRDHNGIDPLDEFLDYPGKMIGQVIRTAIRNDFWQARFLNINLPSVETNKVRCTRLLFSGRQYWPGAKLDREAQRFSYPFDRQAYKDLDIALDTDAIDKGYISITPIDPTMVDKESLKKMGTNTFSL